MESSASPMEPLTEPSYGRSMTTTTTSTSARTLHRPEPATVVRAVQKRSFANLATVSAAGRPHVAGVLYEAVGTTLYLNTTRTTRKARNVAATGHVAVSIPIRRAPVGPPSLVHFQASAELLEPTEAEIVDLVSAGELASITSHGELDLPGSVFVRVDPSPRWHTYGLGMSLLSLIRNPLDGAGLVELAPTP